MRRAAKTHGLRAGDPVIV